MGLTRELVILAGGLGTRLRTVSANRPKAMMNLGGEPIIYWKLLEAKLQGFSKVFLSVGYRSESIYRYLTSMNFEGLAIEIVRDSTPAQGTAAAVSQAAMMAEGAGVFITYADSLNFCDREEVDSLWQNPISTITFSRFLSPGSSPNVQKLNHGKVLYGNSASKATHVEHGLLVLKAQDFDQLEMSNSLPGLMSTLSGQGLLAGMEVFNRFWEIGTPESYHEVTQRFERREHEWFFEKVS